jgi:polyhydroxyalkanoate synthase
MADQGTRELLPRAAIAPPSPAEAPDPAGYSAMFDVLDRAVHAGVARFTFGLSPRAMASAYLDWLGGLAFAPGKQAQLMHKAQRKWMRFWAYVQTRFVEGDGQTCCIEPLPQDRRFADPAWSRAPYSFYYQAFLLTQQWWHNATTGIRGVTPQHERAVAFAARQWLDMISPSNFLWTNPQVIDATLREGGANLVRGFTHALEDARAQLMGRGPAGADVFQVGVNLATTPGKVVYANDLIELIQYAPTTDKVHPEPVLIVPAWIMKYYILDLAPQRSLVEHLVRNGHTVFMISWKNPTHEDRDLDLGDYLRLGPMAALNAIGEIVPETKTHAAGYCLGGTLLAIAAAAMARDGDARLQSLTFFATQVDFEEAGELMLFINEKQIAFLEDLMWEQGFLDSKQMAGAFQLLRSNDLIWSRNVREYLLGARSPLSDLMAWNADGTRLPFRMHAQYLEQLFLRNDLAEGRYLVDGAPVSIADIESPIFAVSTETDHVAPWRSVFKLHQLTDAELTFVLTNGGHNAGIVSDARDGWRRYCVATRRRGGRRPDADQWRAGAAIEAGSWWPAWSQWLAERSGDWVSPPPMGGARQASALLADAPGAYVHMP